MELKLPCAACSRPEQQARQGFEHPPDLQQSNSTGARSQGCKQAQAFTVSQTCRPLG